ncbi:uncharacterized protein LOC103317167 [Nasonia vitripennis]|uniref:Uncharacterized protein n=2 Tax=Nasonia vitripennis TaxID=7425 RepID=A0A7M7QDT1_NASVI|nr:uncharacterized protein LOC103317167 [Nasonia vitripennis]
MRIKINKKKKILNKRGCSIINQLSKPRHSLSFYDSNDESDDLTSNNETDPLAFSTLRNNHSDAGTPEEISSERQNHNGEPVLQENGQRNPENVHNQSNAVEGALNQSNGEENEHNQPDADNEPIPEENYSLNNKFLSKFIIESIDYYKATEGHGYEERNARYKPVNDTGELYLGEQKTVRPDVWRMLQTEKPNVFLREIIMKLWTARDLANRALDLKKVHINIPNRSPVKRIQLSLLRLLISIFNDFLERQRGYSPEEKAKMLRGSTYILSQKIRDLRSQERGKSAARKRVRYN